MHLAKPIRRFTLLEAIARYAQPSPETKLEAKTMRTVGIVVNEKLSALVPKFLSNVRRNPSAIAAALARGDFSTIQSLGHNMKGTGASFGLPQISEIGSELEDAAKTENADSVRAITAGLVRFLDSVEVRDG